MDEEKKRGDSLLYAMIPKAVADRLRKGITALETCQVQTHATHTIIKANHTSPPMHLPKKYTDIKEQTSKHRWHKVTTMHLMTRGSR